MKKDLDDIEENGPQTQRFSAGVSSMGRNAKSFATLKDNTNYPVENFARIRLQESESPMAKTLKFRNKLTSAKSMNLARGQLTKNGGKSVSSLRYGANVGI